MTARRQAIGASGEAAVARWYERRGYQVESRNWRCPIGEIDLVLRQGQSLVICEVKTRSNAAFGGPFAAVGPQKQARLRRLAGQYARAHGRRGDHLRIDVAGVMPTGIEVIEAAC